MKLSICGLDCSGCDFYQSDCEGCQAVKGKPFWAETVCELFSCCLDRKFATCGDCDQLPCKKFIELKDPNISQEQHLQEVRNRVSRLKEMP